jgi:hypothetical protein
MGSFKTLDIISPSDELKRPVYKNARATICWPSFEVSVPAATSDPERPTSLRRRRREITPKLRPPAGGVELGGGRDGCGAGAGGLPEAEEGAGDADGQPGSAGLVGRALHLLRPEHSAGAPQPQVLHRAASARHQSPLPRRLAPRPQGVLLFTRTSVSLLPWIYLSFRSLVVAGSRRG